MRSGRGRGGGPTIETTFEVNDELRRVASGLAGRGLCAECFGRVVGRAGHGLSNPERAERLRAAVPGITFAEGTACRLCAGAFDRWETWLRRSEEAARGYEWHRFTVGSRWDPELLAREEAIWTEVGSPLGESARAAFNRELGKRLAARTGAEGGPAPADLTFLVDLAAGRVEVTLGSVYVEGRYRKLDRTLPQTRWPCRRCAGRGCERCHGSGKMYPESVEELVAAPFVEASAAEGTRFHGMGREDIDARMLGRGRPFVLELLRPHRRSLDLPALQAEVNARSAGRVEVEGMVAADATAVIRVKESSPLKSYRVVVRGEVPEAKINEALALVPRRAIAQRTPTRVVHRRADRVRTRRIVAVTLAECGPGRFTLELRAEAGTYIKEWVEGDGGRTDPSLAQLLGAPLAVESLDVLEIHDQE